MLPNIYFSGFAGSGKSYLVEYLKNKYKAIQAKFAFPVYGIARDWFNMQGKDRALLQLIGTDVGRNLIDQNLWINRFKEDIKIVENIYIQKYNTIPLFTSDDCRFKNEHLTLKELGWVGIWLDVPFEIRKQRLIGRDGSAQEETLNHISEVAMNEFKNELIQLDASGNLDHTYQRLEEVLEFIRREKVNG